MIPVKKIITYEYNKINLKKWIFKKEIYTYIKLKTAYDNKTVFLSLIYLKSLLGWNDGIILGYGRIEKLVI